MTALAHLRTAPLGTVEVLREIDGLLDRVDTGDVCGGPAAAAAMGDVDRVITRLQAVRLSLVAEADRSQVAAGSGMTGTSAWLAASTRRDGGQAEPRSDWRPPWTTSCTPRVRRWRPERCPPSTPRSSRPPPHSCPRG